MHTGGAPYILLPAPCNSFSLCPWKIRMLSCLRTGFTSFDFRSKQLSLGASASFDIDFPLGVTLTGRNLSNDLKTSSVTSLLILTWDNLPHLVIPLLMLLPHWLTYEVSLFQLLMQPSQPIADSCLFVQPWHRPRNHPPGLPRLLPLTWFGLLDLEPLERRSHVSVQSVPQVAQNPARGRGWPELVGWEGHRARGPNPGTCS